VTPPIEAIPTPLPGLFVLRPRIFTDQRGTFIKTYHRDLFRELGVPFTPAEEFFSTSKRGVVRGMHFQTPPAAHAKLVYCVAGSVLDVVVDLRKGAHYGRVFSHELTHDNRQMLFIPQGCAHGFLALSELATLVYQTGTVHTPACDGGVLWDSIGFDWPVEEPILSERDQKFPKVADFASPF
jgi:dTDP-4-dehydrorhamnose 3,5-epimerase